LQFWKYAPYCMLISHPLVVCTCKAFIITLLKNILQIKKEASLYPSCRNIFPISHNFPFVVLLLLFSENYLNLYSVHLMIINNCNNFNSAVCNITLDREGSGNNLLIQPAESGQLLGVREEYILGPSDFDIFFEIQHASCVFGLALKS
jgi:hypothetical protein